MSGLVDKWTTEFSKLREKGQSLFFNSSSPTSDTGVQSDQVVQVQAQEKSSITQFMPRKSPLMLCSQDSVSMLVHCFSP
ncbi:hypothetical protein PTKIN_Ptkin10aG0185500 [Pterospermum kingtungense]